MSQSRDIGKDTFQRTERLLGTEMLERLAKLRVIIFGIGGVGSWCAESLVRTGIGHLTLVDFDCVSLSNVNRQLIATVQTVGRVKVEVLRERLLQINPAANVEAVRQIYTAETAGEFDLGSYDYVIDAIDSLRDKALLILNATQAQTYFLSSMGAALKLDPTRIRVAEFWQVKGCPLAAALRRKFKRQHTFPRHKFPCVYSDELLPNLGTDNDGDETASMLPGAANQLDEPRITKAQINGSLSHITAIFGMTLAGLVVKHAVGNVPTQHA